MFALLALPVLFAVPVWVVAVVCRLVSVALPGRRPDWRVRLLRWGTGMLAAASVGLLVLALGNAEMSDHESRSGTDSSPAPACRDAAPDLVARLVGHRMSYLPPAFDCVLDDGTTYPSSPGYAWLNRLAAASAVASALLAVGARYAGEQPEPGRRSTARGTAAN
ncbi:hypothetical protein [Streptomyces sp. AD55]|uniref:hypothetical protein n=1 Tax=Streptomyces sp. AD55 TaxID=3242895 RepID=UPI0035298CED